VCEVVTTRNRKTIFSFLLRLTRYYYYYFYYYYYRAGSIVRSPSSFNGHNGAFNITHTHKATIAYTFVYGEFPRIIFVLINCTYKTRDPIRWLRTILRNSGWGGSRTRGSNGLIFNRIILSPVVSRFVLYALFVWNDRNYNPRPIGSIYARE